jgi:hypothetical protein
VNESPGHGDGVRHAGSSETAHVVSSQPESDSATQSTRHEVQSRVGM